jgi:hypothetical protein
MLNIDKHILKISLHLGSKSPSSAMAPLLFLACVNTTWQTVELMHLPILKFFFLECVFSICQADLGREIGFEWTTISHSDDC